LEKKLDEKSFLLANLDAFGFYRVSYDEPNLNKIIDQLNRNHEIIPSKMRSQLINDAFGLAQANKLDPIKPFELINYLNNENEYLPWSTFVSGLNFYIDMLGSTDSYGDFVSFISSVIQPIYDKLTWSSSDHDSWLDK
jgi:aminopeptidase N